MDVDENIDVHPATSTCSKKSRLTVSLLGITQRGKHPLNSNVCN